MSIAKNVWVCACYGSLKAIFDSFIYSFIQQIFVE